ncbi:MAG: Gfo/Idh/MocA family oxidoreductase [candidate division KSB1 bacterium]|nr:Gfo/Idh/MocA family oxidoreductase [candidate division KSB1 bacterium]MDZ7273433.1 Gfo/Idh/MocA family oxidoreductase [candidate division KSB1 bacterium]MDZ7286975.1 Gfo/Idh/MocA family oxidoreductase [candidate division KSB1 bacterium]MDZ7299672.1 Gfo/Idh/MocA family oxidoreductase [candidate division KSB1 bacterium]MDZ7307936.1 Gfo/Idh/MocA family oxidoreductase [candidate division KSB1 bacterium]
MNTLPLDPAEQRERLLHSLLQHGIFQNVPAHLTAQLTAGMLQTFRKGEVLLKEGEPAQTLVIILRGQVNIMRGQIFLVRRGPGEMIGEQGVIDQVPYSADAVAHDEVEALLIPADLARALLHDYHFTLNIIKSLSGKLREATQEQAIRFAAEENMFAAFRSHVHPRVLDDLLAKGLEAYGAPRYIDCAILFCDMRSYTALSLAAAPEAIVNELSRYLDAMIEVIHSHGGMIDKFIGDNVMAVWGFEPPQEGAAIKALDCALEMHEVAQKYSFGGQPIKLGMGLNYGTVFCGNVGNARKRQFTVLGQPVNLASRLEALSKVLDSPIVIGESFYHELPWPRQRLFQVHHGVAVRGIGTITCYSLRSERNTHKVVHWGLIGCGAVAEKKSGPAYRKARHSDLVMVMRRDAAKCEDYARRHGIKLWTTCAEELINHPEVEAVTIATPPHLHRHYALLAAAAGKPTIVEKPMARTYAECVDMLRAFEAARVPLFVAYYRRAFQKFQHLRTVISRGRLGTIKRVQLRYRRRFTPIDPQDVPWRFNPEIAGGGLLLDLGSHAINILQFLFDEAPWQILEARVEPGLGPFQVEKSVAVQAGIGNDISADLLWDFAAEKPEDWVLITGERGEAEFSVFAERPYTITTRSAGWETYPFQPPEHVQQPFIQMVVNHLCYGTEAPSDGKSAAMTNWVIDKILGRI